MHIKDKSHWHCFRGFDTQSCLLKYTKKILLFFSTFLYKIQLTEIAAKFHGGPYFGSFRFETYFFSRGGSLRGSRQAPIFFGSKAFCVKIQPNFFFFFWKWVNSCKILIDPPIYIKNGKHKLVIKKRIKKDSSFFETLKCLLIGTATVAGNKNRLV